MQSTNQWINSNYVSGINAILSHAMCILLLLFGLTACSQSDTSTALNDSPITSNQNKNESEKQDDSPTDGGTTPTDNAPPPADNGTNNGADQPNIPETPKTPDEPNTPEPPINTTSANIYFPPANSLTDKQVITLRGIATANKGARIIEVSVNGITATSDDNFETWIIENFPLNLGNNALVLGVKDNQGNTFDNLDTANIKVQVMPNLISFNENALIVDKNNNRALIMDESGYRSNDAIIAIDLSTGKRTVHSSNEIKYNVLTSSLVGEGVKFKFGSNIDFDAENNRVIVSDTLQRSLTQVDLSTGKRTTLIKFNNRSKNKNLQRLDSAVLDTKNNRIIFIEGFANKYDVIEFNLNSKKIKVLSSFKNKGSGLIFKGPHSVDYDVIHDLLYVYDRSRRAIMKVDLNNKGLRSVVSSDDIGTGLGFKRVESLRLNADKTLAIVADRTSKSIIEVDLTTGNRRVVSGYMVNDDERTPVLVGTGEAFLTPEAVDYADNDTLVVLDHGRENPIMVNASTGNRSELGDRHIGNGPSMNSPGAIAKHNGKLLVADYANHTIMSVDPNNGDRKVVLDGTKASTAMNQPTFIVHDASGKRLFVMDNVADGSLPRILEWRIGSANPDVIFEINADKKAFVEPSAMLFDAKRNRLIIADSRFDTIKLVSLDLTTRTPKVLSGLDETDSQVGEGDRFVSITATALKDEDTLLLVDRKQAQLFEIDLNTGNRKKIFKPITFNDNKLANLSGVKFMKYDAKTDHLWFLGFSSVFAMDLKTGNINRVTETKTTVNEQELPSIGLGFKRSYIIDFLLDSNKQLAYLTDLKHSAILQLDLTTGQTTVLSWSGRAAVFRPFGIDD